MNKEKEAKGLNMEEMARAGLHFGHHVSKTHPKMKEFVYGERRGLHIMDLEKTTQKFNIALDFIAKLVAEEKIILVVGTKVQTKDLAKEMAQECDLPHITFRWLGGTFTNFDTIKKRIFYFKSIEEKKRTGELEKYTKKERAGIDKELRDLETRFGGIRNLEKLPDAILVLDPKKEKTAVREAKRKNVPVIAITDTDDNPKDIDYIIPANNDAISSIKYILEEIKKTILNAKIKK